MERLTERDEFGNADIIGVDSADLQMNLEFDEFNKVTDALNKLADCEDAEENGTLIKLPCKVGDEVWFIENEYGEYDLAGYIFLAVCKNYIIATSDYMHCDGITEQLEEMSSESIENYGDVGDIMVLPMKDCFFTREAAEKALKERNNENRSD